MNDSETEKQVLYNNKDIYIFRRSKATSLSKMTMFNVLQTVAQM